jgi:hypothetical protein
MNLSLSKDEPRNTILTLPDGRPLYQIETPSKFIGTEVTRIKNAAQNYSDTGMIEWHSFHTTVIYVGQRLIEPHKGGTFGSSKVFQAMDGQMYKWKTKAGCPELVTDDNVESVLAVYHKSHHGLFSESRLATLDITPQGMHILDDIVTTFVWFEHKRRESNQSSINAGIIAGASG